MTTTEQAQLVERVLDGISPTLRAANTDDVARQANAITAIYGLTGSGKSALADTACEYCFETFGMITLCYANDPGGFGNKRLSLIRLGLMKVWDPTNHINAFETMELISLGAWPETIIDPDRGFADPTVKLILPRRLAYVLTCPEGHDVQSFDNEAVLNASNVNCPACGKISNIQNTQGIKRAIVKSRLFANVGLRIFDSVTGMNDRGLIIELPTMSAKGTIATNKEGGGVLASADALRQGTVVYGSGSKAQVGFMQNRSYQWLVNIRSIPDQVVPAICTFGVEQSKVDDESGGEMILGPKISGNARTSSVPGWVGNCLHASKEPLDGTTIDPVTGGPAMVHRLWLTNHIDPRRPDKIPYLAKHRGTPLGMPDYLQDDWTADTAARAANAWQKCSLKVFFKLLERQFAAVLEQDKARYANAPALLTEQAEAVDEIIPIAAGAVVTGTTVSTPAAAGDGVAVTVRGGRTLRSRRGMVATPMPAVAPVPVPAVMQPVASAPVVAAPAAVTTAPQVPEAPAVPVAAPTGSTPGSAVPTPAAAPAAAASLPAVGVAAPSVVQQLEASLATRTAPAPSGNAAPAVAAGAVSQAAPAPSAPVSMAPSSMAPATTGPRVVRRPRPPV